MGRLKNACIALCRQNNVSRRELAKRVDVSRHCLNSLLDGKSCYTYLYTIYRLAEAFGYTIGALLPDEDHIELDLREAIRRERENQGLTKHGLSRKAGLSADTVDKLENKPEFGFTVNTLEKLAETLDIELLLVPKLEKG